MEWASTHRVFDINYVIAIRRNKEVTIHDACRLLSGLLLLGHRVDLVYPIHVGIRGHIKGMATLDANEARRKVGVP